MTKGQTTIYKTYT